MGILKYIFAIFSFFNLFFLGFNNDLFKTLNKNNNDQNKINNNIEVKEDATINVSTSNVDWTGFNASDRILPTWELKDEGIELYDKDFLYAIIIDQDSTGLPNGGYGEDFEYNNFNSIYYYSMIVDNGMTWNTIYDSNNSNVENGLKKKYLNKI